MTTTDTTEKSQDPNNTIVILDTPLKRGDSTVDSITLRKPMSGELRGVTLVDLVQMDVLALRKVLPRISIPSLTDHEIGTMDPADLMACGIAVSGFLLQKSAKEAVLAA